MVFHCVLHPTNVQRLPYRRGGQAAHPDGEADRVGTIRQLHEHHPAEAQKRGEFNKRQTDSKARAAAEQGAERRGVQEEGEPDDGAADQNPPGAHQARRPGDDGRACHQ